MAKLAEQAPGLGGALAAGAAVLASSCCGVPLALAMMGVGGGVIGLIGPLLAWRTPLLVLAGLLVAAGWILAIRRRGKSAYPLLALASLLLAIAFAAPWWEPRLTHMLMGLNGRP